MVTLVRTVLGVLWAVWFGGIVAVFLFATAMFSGLTRETAALANGILFPTFERYALVTAALTLAATVAWRGLSRSRAATWTFGFLAVGTVALVVSASVVTPRILELRRTAQTQSPAFGRAHGQSAVLYIVETAALLAAGITLLASRGSVYRAEHPGDEAKSAG